MKSCPHDSAHVQVSGFADYIDDRPILANEVFVDVLYSPCPRGTITQLDCSLALEDPEVLAIYTHKDLHNNKWGSIFQDQPLLADGEVHYVGEPIAVIAASNKFALLKAKRDIKLEIAPQPAILSLAEAIEQESFIGPLRTINFGDVENVLPGCENKIKGELNIAGQDHFYLESQASIAYPIEGDALEIHSSSQHPTEVQHIVAEALGLKFHQVVCEVKRMGGAFGGKESQAAPFAVFASLVAHKLNRPARITITKDDDMIMTGKRNPFKNFYEVGFDDSGKILALKAELYSDGGAYADLSTAIMERAMLHIDNTYAIPNLLVTGQVCRTNTPPNTAFRGFGGPKGVATIENIIEQIAERLNIDALEVRKANVYHKGDTTHYGQSIEDNVLPQLFNQAELDYKYQERRQEISQHNKSNKETLRGLSLTAVKFGISFTTRFLNQGNALVNLHMDGTVQVSTGATEMGQGVNTKIAQVVAQCFSIPVQDVKIMTTSTEKNPNTSATAASSGSDINGQAALHAAETIRTNLAKVASAVFKRPQEWRGRPVAGAGTVPEIVLEEPSNWEDIVFDDGKVFNSNNPREILEFKELIEEAYLNRISLTAQGFFRYPNIHFNKETGQGKPFHYFTNGVACSEVSIDKFTGELKILRSDILMDLGRPINREIDMGQVTGGFVQGAGWVTTENLYYSDGLLVSHSPSTYKIPSVHDIPRVFNCQLIDNPLNKDNLKSSKAVGEPPLLLAVSVWAAAKNALREGGFYNKDLRIPATQETLYRHMRQMSPSTEGLLI